MKELSDQEVLQAAIDKAIDGGWRGDLLSDFYLESQPDGLVRVYWDDTEWSILDVLFSHEFCKALWPGSTNAKRPMSHFHMQQMVLAEDRIAYLRRHL